MSAYLASSREWVSYCYCLILISLIPHLIQFSALLAGPLPRLWEAPRGNNLHMQCKCCNASFASFSRLKTEQSRKTKLLVVKSIFVPIVTYGHEFWEKVQSQMHAPKMRFLRKLTEVTMVDNLCNTAIRESLDIE